MLQSIRPSASASAWTARRILSHVPSADTPSMTVVNRLPAAEAGRQIPPGEAGPLPEQNPVDHTAVVLPASTPPAIRRQVWLQRSPLFIRKISPPHVPRNELPSGSITRPIGHDLARLAYAPCIVSSWIDSWVRPASNGGLITRRALRCTTSTSPSLSTRPARGRQPAGMPDALDTTQREGWDFLMEMDPHFSVAFPGEDRGGITVRVVEAKDGALTLMEAPD